MLSVQASRGKNVEVCTACTLWSDQTMLGSAEYASESLLCPKPQGGGA